MPSLLQWIVGSGTPDAVQAMTTGDSLVTTISAGSSAIDGGTAGGRFTILYKGKINQVIVYNLRMSTA